MHLTLIRYSYFFLSLIHQDLLCISLTQPPASHPPPHQSPSLSIPDHLPLNPGQFALHAYTLE